MTDQNEPLPLAASFEREDIGKMLRILREGKGLTQVRAAELMGSNSQRLYAQYELGTSIPTLKQLEKLLGIFGYKLEIVAIQKKLKMSEVLKSYFNKMV